MVSELRRPLGHPPLRMRVQRARVEVVRALGGLDVQRCEQCVDLVVHKALVRIREHMPRHDARPVADASLHV
eukprot:2724220-Pyramimonas_sp.AAC.2